MISIYAIQFNTGEAYIGCTSGKIGKRFREHRCLLKNRKHTSKMFQVAHDRYGPSDMQMKTLEILPNDSSVIEKRERELFWLRKYEEEGLLLNHSVMSFQPPVGAPAKAAKARQQNGYKPSPESNIKRRMAQLGKPKGHGAKISATKRVNRI